MKWEIPLLVSFVFLLGIFSSFPVVDSNFTIDENGLKHYVLTPEKNISSFDVVATSLSKYNREVDFDEQDPYFVFFLFVLLLVLLYRSNFVLQVKQSVLKTFASDYINLFLKNNFAQTLFSENKINLKEIFVILSSSNTKLQNNSTVLYRNCSNVLINSKKFFVSKKIIVVLLLFVVLIVPVYNHAYAASGDITKSLVDSFEFDNQAGSYPDIIQIDSNTFAISYQGQGSGVLSGYIQTFDIDSLGNISSLNTLQFDPDAIVYTELVAVDSDTFAIVYRSTDADGFIHTVDITGAGVITNGTNYEFDTTAGTDPQIVAVDSDTFAVVNQGGGADGWLRTLNISSDGLTISEEDSFEFDTNEGRDNDIIQVDSDTFLIVYRGVEADGFAKTINISTDGTINSVEDTLEFEPTFDAYHNAIAQVDSDTFVVAYRDIDSDGRLATLDVTSSGSITLVETYEYDTNTAQHPDIKRLDDKSFVIAYQGAGSDGFIKTIPITASGNIGTVTDTYEFDTGNGRFPSIISIDGNTVAIASRGGGNDGFLDTIFIDVELAGTDTPSFVEVDDSSKTAIIMASSTPVVVSEGLNSINPELFPASTVNPTHGFEMGIYASSTPIPAHEVTISTIKTNDTFEFDTADAETPDLVQVDTDTFAVVYKGTDNDGFIKTVDITSTGTITDTGNSLEFDTADGWTPNIVPVDTDTFAVVYNGTDSDGFVKTLNISGVGAITDTGNSLEFDIADGLYPDIVAVDSDTFAIVYTGTDTDGFIKTLNISGVGAITDTGNSLEFDTGTGIFPDILAVDSDTFVISYTGNGNDGFVKTVDITGAGVISSVIDTLEFDTSTAYETSLVKIDDDTFAVAYRGPGSDGFVKTFDIDSSGNINNSITDSLEFDTGNGREPDMVSLGSGNYGIAYRGNSNDGFFVIVTIDDAGNIGNSVVESLEYNTSNGYFPSLIGVDLNTFAIAHRGNAEDGFITTIDTSNELAFSDSDTLDVVESVDLIKKYAIFGTSAPIFEHSVITTGNSIIDDANSTPLVVSSAITLKGYFLNANSTPNVSDSGNTVAQYTRTASDILDVAEQNTEFKNYTISNSTTPDIVSSGIISFSLSANSTPLLTSNATSSADISSNSTPLLSSNATTVAMFVLDPSTIPSVSSTATVAFTLSANSTPLLTSNATSSADISSNSTPVLSSNATSTVMRILNATSIPSLFSNATSSADISSNSTPVLSSNATSTVMRILNATSIPSLFSNATSSADISSNSTPVLSSNATSTVMRILNATSIPSLFSNATSSADISSNSTPVLSSNATSTVMRILNATSIPSLFSNATSSADISSNSTPVLSSNATSTVMRILNATSIPSLFSNATSSADISSNSTPVLSSNATSTVMRILNATSIPSLFSNATSSADISSNSTPVLSSNATSTVMRILNATSIPSLFSNATSSADISGSSTPFLSSNATSTVMRILNATSIPSLFSNATSSADISSNSTPVLSSNATSTVMRILNATSIPSLFSNATSSADISGSSTPFLSSNATVSLSGSSTPFLSSNATSTGMFDISSNSTPFLSSNATVSLSGSSTPFLSSNATSTVMRILNATSEPVISSNATTVAMFNLNATSIPSLFGNATVSLSGSSTPVLSSNATYGTLVASANTTPFLSSNATVSLSGSSTPFLSSNATSTVMHILSANSSPVVSSNAITTGMFNISANSTPVLSSNATSTVMRILNATSEPVLSDDAQITGMFNISANSTPVLSSNATSTVMRILNATSEPVLSDDAQITGMFNISANSTPVLSSNATSTVMRILNATSEPVLSDDAQITGMFNISANSTPVLSSNATSTVMRILNATSEPVLSDDAQITGMFNISANSTPVLSDNAQVTGMFTINANSTPVLSDNAQVTGMFTINANSTPVLSDNAQVTGMFTINANSTPVLSDNAQVTGMFTINANSTPVLSDNATSDTVFALLTSDAPSLTESIDQIERYAINAIDVPVISESVGKPKHSKLLATSTPRITEFGLIAGHYTLETTSIPEISHSGNIPPRITSANVTSTTQIDIAFERNIDRKSVKPANFVLTDPSATIKGVKTTNNVITLRLDSAITSGQTPTIAIAGNAVKDTDGNTVDSVTVTSVDKVPPKVKKAYATTKSSIVIIFDKNVTSQLSDYSSLQIPTGTSKTISGHTASDNVVTLTVNSADITARAHGTITISSGLTDTNGNSFNTNHNPVSVISNIEEAPVELDEDFTDLVITTEEIEIKEILVKTNVKAKLDLSKSPTKTTVTENSVTKNRVQITNEMKITSSDGTDEEVQIVIPKDVLVSGPQDKFTGSIDLPEPKTNNSCPINPDGSQIVSCIAIGLSDDELTFNKAVKITIPGEGSLTPYYSTDNTTWNAISTLCDAANTAEVNGVSISSDGTRECYFVDGSDMIIWTTHFTVFGTLSSTSTSSSSGGGSSGDNSAPSITTSIGPSITDSGLGGIIGNTDQPLVPGAEIKNYPLVFDGIGYDENSFNSVHTAVIETEQPLNVILSLYENSGAQNIEHVEMYVNHFGPRVLNDRTETAIIYDKFTGIEILDPYGLISDATVLPTLLDTQSQFYFQVFFEEEIEQSDVLFRVWDKNRNSVELHLSDALMVVKGESSSEERNVTESGIVSPTDPSESEIVSPADPSESEIVSPADPSESEIISTELPPESEKIKIPSEPELGTYVGIPMDPEPGIDVNLQMDPEPGIDVNLQMDPEPGIDVNLQMDPEPGIDVNKPKSLLDSISEFFEVLTKLLKF
ncbi:beta strand repeat-containing protein [Nitrosopumilus maritimus]|uniref:Uncharacterized protein n=1 Tax=Nitrosopumilus maritimus (strain SCM1) TaxID=436308 RepID=A9A166_NITMS|nr:hypothetical protein [Nitrosopumilus maritimus]ABX12352.1 hypothetical protein Nmar_0456 [Nitrosopumilus maritimus SCM1]